MAGAKLIYDDSAMLDALARVVKAAESPVRALKNIGEYGAKSSRARFRSQTAPDGKPWQALNALYKKTKKGPSILTGESRDLSQIIWQLAADANGVEWGSNVPYARIHNQGGEIRPKTASALVFSMGGRTFHVQKVTIPQRQFVGINAADEEAIGEIISDFLADARDGNIEGA